MPCSVWDGGTVARGMSCSLAPELSWGSIRVAGRREFHRALTLSTGGASRECLERDEHGWLREPLRVVRSRCVLFREGRKLL